MELARFQRPGVILIVGPTEAREDVLRPLNPWQISKLPGDSSFARRDLRLRLQFMPGMFACFFAGKAAKLGYDATNEEWVWLNGRASLEDACRWLSQIAADPAPLPDLVPA
jgi:hypothetical protein